MYSQDLTSKTSDLYFMAFLLLYLENSYSSIETHFFFFFFFLRPISNVTSSVKCCYALILLLWSRIDGSHVYNTRISMTNILYNFMNSGRVLCIICISRPWPWDVRWTTVTAYWEGVHVGEELSASVLWGVNDYCHGLRKEVFCQPWPRA